MYPSYIVHPGTKEDALTDLHYDNYKIWKTHILDIQTKLKDIDYEDGKCLINVDVLEPTVFGDIKGLELADVNCCWSYMDH